MIQDATIRVTLFKSKTLANGEHPLMLVVTKDGKRKYSALGISCHPDKWNFQKNEPKKNHPDKLKIETIIAKRIAEIQSKALDLKLYDKDFTSDSLVATVQKPRGANDLFAYVDGLVANFIQNKEVGNANLYRDVTRILKKFAAKKTLPFSDIDVHFLNRWESHCKNKNMAETSLSVYFRTLRAIFNRAIKDHIVSVNYYPFRDFKISKFDTRTRKRAIDKSDIQKIKAVNVIGKPVVQLSKDVFLFSYYGQGMNLTDIAHLRWSQIVQDRLFYVRAKTGKEFNLKLMEPARQILEYYRPLTGGNPNNYVFPILNTERHITPIQIDNRIHKMNSLINKHLKAMGQTAGIETPLTTYVARHSYATVLKTSGISIAVISEALGHETEAITQTYLKSFENSVIEEANENLL
ncbi:MAG TPA: site-specific integrase [Saprospiraceae bacterium]|nr:site-specific integrase [Saprospiraceae bacterium]